MIRTQIQLPEPLYAELKRVASQCDWSLAEVIRRAGEQFVARYPKSDAKVPWSLPGPYNLGEYLARPEDVDHEAEAIEAKLKP